MAELLTADRLVVSQKAKLLVRNGLHSLIWTADALALRV